MKGSLIIVGFFILGIVVGNADLAPVLLRDSDVSFVALCGLLFCVGLGIGMNPDTKRDLRSINPRYALLANIIREMITLLLAPLLAKVFGPLAPITASGATSMDTTLPIITHTIGDRYTALSIYHGFVVDFTVPFLVTMWCLI